MQLYSKSCIHLSQMLILTNRQFHPEEGPQVQIPLALAPIFIKHNILKLLISMSNTTLTLHMEIGKSSCKGGYTGKGGIGALGSGIGGSWLAWLGSVWMVTRLGKGGGGVAVSLSLGWVGWSGGCG